MSEDDVNMYKLPVTAGSDAHREEDIAITGIESEYEIKTAEDFIKLIKSGEAKIIKEQI